jgi:DNA-binding protein HU-beta
VQYRGNKYDEERGKHMNKAELIGAVAEKLNATRKDAEKAVNAVFDTITETPKGDKVQMVGFGAFEAKRRATHSGFNPRTNEPMEIPETVLPVQSR